MFVRNWFLCLMSMCSTLFPNKYAPGKDIGKVIENTEPLFGAKGSRDMLKVMLCFF